MFIIFLRWKNFSKMFIKKTSVTLAGLHIVQAFPLYRQNISQV
jgi:hypothetical protein